MVTCNTLSYPAPSKLPILCAWFSQLSRVNILSGLFNPRSPRTLFKVIWKKHVKSGSLLFIPRWVSGHTASSRLWPGKSVCGAHQLWSHGVIGKTEVGMIDHGMYVIWFAEDKTQWAPILTHSFVTKFRNSQGLASCRCPVTLPGLLENCISRCNS